MPDFFLNNWWPGVLLWAVLYVLDYAMTIRCARLYRAGACEKFVFEGSFELTPLFQKDIDGLRTVSPRFLAMLVVGGTLLAVMWVLATQLNPGIYAFVLGSMIGIQLVVHVRHLQNYVLFRYFAATDGVKGRIEYSRAVMLRMSALSILTFGLMFALLAGLTLNWFLAGAAAACVSTASKHFTWARKHAADVPQKANALSAV